MNIFASSNFSSFDKKLDQMIEAESNWQKKLNSLFFLRNLIILG